MSNKIPNNGEYVHVPELGVWRAKNKGGRMDAFKTEDEAKKHASHDPFAGLSSLKQSAQKHNDRLNATFGNRAIKKFTVKEEAPVNSAGGGNIAAIGVGPQGEPPGKINKKRKSFKEFRRNM
jgi:hypothetical protein